MANPEHLALVGQGAKVWNAWRQENQTVRPDLSNTRFHKCRLDNLDLSDSDLRNTILNKAHLVRSRLCRADLHGVKLKRAVLRHANLSNANLHGADLGMAELRDSDLREADLGRASLRGAKLDRAILHHAQLARADFLGSTLTGCDLGEAQLLETVFADTNLASVNGLDTCKHMGPSIIDHRTLDRSGVLPRSFLEGCGLPENVIKSLLRGQTSDFFSCFISYSNEDGDFAHRIRDDLEKNGVRCWFAPDDMAIGDKIVDRLDREISQHDKVLLILSRDAIRSPWVEDEVIRAFEEERRRGHVVLVPVRIDEIVLTSEEAWAVKLRSNRHIGNFTDWRHGNSYQRNLRHLLKALAINHD